MLFTRISLDDFDDCLARFLERLGQDLIVARSTGQRSDGLGQVEWFMMATINIASLLQYGAEDGVLHKTANKETPSAPTATQSHSRANDKEGHSRSTSKANPPGFKAPQAIMMNPSSLKREGAREYDENTGMEEIGPAVVKQLNSGESRDEDPLVFRLAQRVTFGTLSLLLDQPPQQLTPADISLPNPYIVLLLTFTAHLAQHAAALRHLEKALPWAQLTQLFNAIPPGIVIKVDAAGKLAGAPLPEDWCIRGMDWTGRHLFARGHWKPSGTASRDDMPSIGPPSSLDSEMDALRFDLDALDADSDLSHPDTLPSVMLAKSRWKRVARTAMSLTRNVAGLDFDVNARRDSCRFIILGHLDTKLRRWKKDADQAAEQERLSLDSLKIKQAQDSVGSDSESDSEESDEESGGSDSSLVKELKVRPTFIIVHVVIPRLTVGWCSSPAVASLDL